MSFIPRIVRRAAPLSALTAGAFAFQQQQEGKAHCGFFDFLASSDVKAKKDIIAIIEKEEERRSEKGDPSSIAPTFVRLAWHASGTYSKEDGTGGSNGAHMRMSPESGTCVHSSSST
jgi:catalase (peroxidase I)